MKHISIAMCTFNGGAFLQEQLRSIAAQDLQPSELIICDDGSADATSEIVSDFSRDARFPVQFIGNNTKLGSTKNFEHAISLCSGDYIALCDQDDIWEPQKLRILADALQSSRAGGVFSDGMQVSADGSDLGRTLWTSIRFHDRQGMFARPGNREHKIASLLRGNMVTGATLMVRADLRSTFMPFPQEWVHDGWIAWMLALHADMVAVRQPLIRYRVHGTQQVGTPAASIRKRLHRTRLHGSAIYAAQARQFAVLLQYAESHPDLCSAEFASKLEQRRKFALFRSQLSRNRMRRLVEITGRATQYGPYAHGWYSMIKDVMV